MKGQALQLKFCWRFREDFMRIKIRCFLKWGKSAEKFNMKYLE